MRVEKNMALGARFQKLRGRGGGEGLTAYYQGGGGGSKFSEGQGKLNSQRGLHSRGLPLFFCKSIISEAAMLLIIHITMNILK